MTNATFRESPLAGRSKFGVFGNESNKSICRARFSFGVLVLAWLFASVAISRADTPGAAAAAAFIEGTAHSLIAIVDGPGDPASQTRQLQDVVNGAVDVEGIARFCMGRFWPSSSPAQRQAFLGLFRSVLMDGVTGQIRTYKGVTVTVGRVQPRDADAEVSTVVLRPGKEPAKVDWVVASTPAGLKITDVVAEGTSLRLTRRNDYATYLGSHGGNVDMLLAAMRQRLAQP